MEGEADVGSLAFVSPTHVGYGPIMSRVLEPSQNLILIGRPSTLLIGLGIAAGLFVEQFPFLFGQVVEADRPAISLVQVEI